MRRESVPWLIDPSIELRIDWMTTSRGDVCLFLLLLLDWFSDPRETISAKPMEGRTECKEKKISLTKNVPPVWREMQWICPRRRRWSKQINGENIFHSDRLTSSSTSEEKRSTIVDVWRRGRILQLIFVREDWQRVMINTGKDKSTRENHREWRKIFHQWNPFVFQWTCLHRGRKTKWKNLPVQIEEEMFVDLHLESNRNNRAKISPTNHWKKGFLQTFDKWNHPKRTTRKEDHHFVEFREREETSGQIGIDRKIAKEKEKIINDEPLKLEESIEKEIHRSDPRRERWIPERKELLIDWWCGKKCPKKIWTSMEAIPKVFTMWWNPSGKKRREFHLRIHSNLGQDVWSEMENIEEMLQHKDPWHGGDLRATVETFPRRIHFALNRSRTRRARRIGWSGVFSPPFFIASASVSAAEEGEGEGNRRTESSEMIRGYDNCTWSFEWRLHVSIEIDWCWRRCSSFFHKSQQSNQIERRNEMK